ncbi:MAG: hypothetical protein Fur0012_06090 [Elusimicrobiota bacterium]
MLAEVSFPVPLNRTFHYKIPAALEKKIFLGAEVVCPFGKSRSSRGVVVAFSDSVPQGLDPILLKEIEGLAFETPAYDFEAISKVVKFCSNKWYSPQGLYYGLFYENSSRANKKTDRSLIAERYKKENPLVDKLEKGAEKILFRGDFDIEAASELSLRKADSGGQTLFLAPDYLTALALYRKLIPQTGIENCAFFHGSLLPKKKKEIFADVLSGRIKYVVGPKSAIFLPYSKNSLFIVIQAESEFHSQFEQRPFYDACTLALNLAYSFSHKIILFSLSPKIELLASAKNEGLEIIEGRTSSSGRTIIIDARKNEFKPLSDTTIKVLGENLEKGKKSLVICQAKGFAFKSFCPVCGWVGKCSKCHVNLRLYREEEGYFYKCPLCLERAPYSDKCPSCSADILKTSGHGTQKIAQFLSENFPTACLLRLDSDIVKKSGKGQEKIYENLILGNYDVLVGTSALLSRPLYFSSPSAVVFAGLNPDRHNSGFRESELNFQKLISASALSGAEGSLIVETFEPDNTLFSYNLDYSRFSADEMETRKVFFYPPFCDILAVRLVSKDKEALRSAALKFSSFFSEERKKKLDILEYRHTEKIRTDRMSGLSSHGNFFKIVSGSTRIGEWLSTLNLPKEVRLAITPGEFWK